MHQSQQRKRAVGQTALRDVPDHSAQTADVERRIGRCRRCRFRGRLVAMHQPDDWIMFEDLEEPFVRPDLRSDFRDGFSPALQNNDKLGGNAKQLRQHSRGGGPGAFR